MKTYLIKRSGNSETFLKVGVTSRTDSGERHNYGRTKTIDSDLPLSEKMRRVFSGKKYMDDGAYPDYTSLAEFDFSHDTQAYYLEHLVIEEFKNIKYVPRLPFSGHSECFIFSEANQKAILEYFRQAAQSVDPDWKYKLKYALCAYEVYNEDPVKKHLEIIEKIRIDSVHNNSYGPQNPCKASGGG